MKTKSLFPLNKIVEVLWEDACGRSGWEDLSVYKHLSPMPCQSVGYLVSKNTDSITLVLTQSIEEGASGGISIPMAWVKKIRVLK